MKRVLVLLLSLVAAAMPLAASAQSYDRYDRGYGAAQVRCESTDYRTRVCRVDTRGGVRLVRQESDTPCVRGRSWGYDRNGIWVSRGCRGRFEVGADYARRDYDRDNGRYDDNDNDRYGYGGGYASSGAQVFRCESHDERQRVCRLPYGVRSVQIRRQLSRTNCSQGYNWGTTRDGVWVDRGCRAEFVAY